jgi:pimeloyl-ACP methyl ester carboxylesterase
LLLMMSICAGCRGFVPADAARPEWVILLHGLARSKASMARMEKHLTAAGFRVLNVGYPSRKQTIEEIAAAFLPEAIQHCRERGARKIHMVAHSMGGIVIRLYLKHHRLPDLGRVVMLSPPNAGSEVVDRLGGNLLFRWLNGPAGRQLGTGPDSLHRRLGPADFELGIITGDRSINLILSTMIPGPDDGKVSVRRARLNGMKDFIVIHAAHPFIMRNREAIRQTLYFLRNGLFCREDGAAQKTPSP